MFNEHFGNLPYSSEKMISNRKEGNKYFCQFCEKQDPLQFYHFSHKHLEKKYFEAFNFYFAKPINELVANLSVPHVIMFKDKIIEDDDNEFLKRFYKRSEVESRVSALTDFYKTYKPLFPNLCIVEQHKLIGKRNQRQVKIFYSKNSNNQAGETELKAQHPKENKEENPEGRGIKKQAQRQSAQDSELENILGSYMEQNQQASNFESDQSQQINKFRENSLLRLFERKYSASSSSSSSLHDIYKPKLSDIFFFDSSEILGFNYDLRKEFLPESAFSIKDAVHPFRTPLLSEVKKSGEIMMDSSHRDYQRVLKEQLFDSLETRGQSKRPDVENQQQANRNSDNVAKALLFKNDGDADSRKTPHERRINASANAAIKQEAAGKKKIQKGVQSKIKNVVAQENFKKINPNIQEVDMLRHLDLLKNVMIKNLGKKREGEGKGLVRNMSSVTPQPVVNSEKIKAAKEEISTKLRSNITQKYLLQQQQAQSSSVTKDNDGSTSREKNFISSPLRHSWEVQSKRAIKNSNAKPSKTDRPISGEQSGKPRVYYKNLHQGGGAGLVPSSKIRAYPKHKEVNSLYNHQNESDEAGGELERNKSKSNSQNPQELSSNEQRKHSKSQNKEKLAEASTKQKMAISQVALLVSENPELFKFATSNVGSIHCTGTNNISINNYVSTYKTALGGLKSNSSPKVTKSTPLSSERQVNSQKPKFANKSNQTPERSPPKQEPGPSFKNLSEEIRRKQEKGGEQRVKVLNTNPSTSSGLETVSSLKVAHSHAQPYPLKEDLKKSLRLNLEKLEKQKNHEATDTREKAAEKPVLNQTQGQDNHVEDNELSTYGFWTSRSAKQAWSIEDLTLMRAMIDKAILENKRKQVKKPCCKNANSRTNLPGKNNQICNNLKKKQDHTSTGSAQTRLMKNKTPHTSYSSKKEVIRPSSALKGNIESLLTLTNMKNKLFIGGIKTDRDNSNSEYSEREFLQKGHLTDRAVSNENTIKKRRPNEVNVDHNNDFSNSASKLKGDYYEIVGKDKNHQFPRKE